MTLGVKAAELHSIEKIADGQYYIKGANFTQSAFLEVNGELVEANFIDENTLLVLDTELVTGDEVDVAIRSNSSTHKVLTRTDKYLYTEPVEGRGEAKLELKIQENTEEDTKAETETKTETETEQQDTSSEQSETEE